MGHLYQHTANQDFAEETKVGSKSAREGLGDVLSATQTGNWNIGGIRDLSVRKIWTDYEDDVDLRHENGRILGHAIYRIVTENNGISQARTLEILLKCIPNINTSGKSGLEIFNEIRKEMGIIAGSTQKAIIDAVFDNLGINDSTPATPPPDGQGGCQGEQCGGPPYSPILIDMGQNEIHLGPQGVYVNFDLDGDGFPESIQWVAVDGDETFLALNLNANGVVDDGAELFGSATWLASEGGLADNGFVGLAQWDEPSQGGNGDGLISEEDSIWNQLLLWNDINADGISTENEISLVQDSGLDSLEITPKENKRRDSAGNWLPLWAWAENDSATGVNQHKMVDVFFVLEPPE